MAIKALSKVAPDWYTPESEKNSNSPTRFMLRPLTPPEKESVMEFSSNNFVIPPHNFGKVLAMGLQDWENFNDDQGQKIKCSIANHPRLPGDIRMELANEILIRSNISEDEEKNS